MDPEDTTSNILVKPKSTCPSTAQMAQQKNDAEERKQILDSSKSTNEEIEDLNSLYSQLHLSIAAPRVERSAGRSQAVWNSEKCLVQIIRKEGKFETFGMFIDGNLYVEFYEALYLLEMNRLQLDYNGMMLSIEQAYLLLLGEVKSPKYNEYLVYSCLTRAGYILKRHQNKFYAQNWARAPTETDCIWAWLLNAVQRRPIPSYIKKTELFSKVKQQIEATKLSIITQKQFTDNCDPVGAVQNLDESAEPKRQKLEVQSTAQEWPEMEERSLLDFLKEEPEFKQFETLFQKFNIIKLKTTKSYSVSADDVRSERNLVFNFDLYLHNTAFKKFSQLPPVMRVLILDSTQPFPNHEEISKYSRNLIYKTPILIISVGDGKQIQAFLYIFS